MGVTYYETRKGTEKRVRHDCFAAIDRVGGKWNGDDLGVADIIRYHAPIARPLTLADAEVYAQFVHQLFGPRAPFSHEIKGQSVIWTLKSKGLSKIKALVYLTTFRYVAELPQLTKALVQRCGAAKDIGARFKTFQRLHVESVKACGEAYNYGGHTLMYTSVHQNVSPTVFRARLRDPKVKSVEGHLAAS